MQNNNTIKLLKLQGVILWHMSDTNIDANKAVKRTKEEVGFNNVFVAEKNFVLPLQKEEF